MMTQVGEMMTSLPPPQPKSPPQYPDLYGKRRELARLQMLEREIAFLQEELKSIEGLQPASTSCKEVADFVTANADPLMPTTKKIRKSCRFWKWLCGVLYFDVSCIWCCKCPSPPHLEMGRCCCFDWIICNGCKRSNGCCNCRVAAPKCHCSWWWNSQCCFRKWTCSLNNCCKCKPPNCPSCSLISCESCFPICPKFNSCSSCHKSCCHCCYPCFFCM